MKISEFISTPLRRASSRQGGEYHGPCPVCGGVDRFHVWPEQRKYGTFWCRACGIGGDAITYLRTVEGMTYKEACHNLGIDSEQLPKNSHRPSTADTYTPREATPPINSTWQAKAAALEDHSHRALMGSAVHLSYLANRGISLKDVVRYRLGYLQQDYFRDRRAWGLPVELKENGKPRRLWLPAGLIIPATDKGMVYRLRIRRHEGEPRYYVVPGSGSGTWCAPSQLAHPTAAVVVESELDAITCAAAVNDMHIIALGNSTARPDQAAHLLLAQAPVVLVALDFDRAGAEAARRWCKWYGSDKVKRWPPPLGKDPGDAFQHGVNIGQWLRAALNPF